MNTRQVYVDGKWVNKEYDELTRGDVVRLKNKYFPDDDDVAWLVIEGPHKGDHGSTVLTLASNPINIHDIDNAIKRAREQAKEMLKETESDK